MAEQLFNPQRKALIVGSCCAASVRCYAAMLTASKVIVDSGETHLPLRHSHHRYEVDGPNGVQKLTVPLVGSTNSLPVPMADVLISEHANWRHLHWGALFSAYGKSPYFDYAADDLAAVINGNQHHLIDFNTQMQTMITEFLDLPICFETRPVSHEEAASSDVIDLRGKIAGKKPDTLPIADVPYYQMWSGNGGFRPRLSIIDLLMNEGREAIFTLARMTGMKL